MPESDEKELQNKKMIQKAIIESGPDKLALNNWLKKNHWKQTGEFNFPDEEYNKMVEWAFDDETEIDKAYDEAFKNECVRLAAEQNKDIRPPGKAQEKEKEKIKREIKLHETY